MKNFYYIIMIIAFVLQSCNTSEIDSYTFLMKSPYKCTHLIKIDNKGYITYQVGLEEGNKGEQIIFEEVFETKKQIKIDDKYLLELQSISKKASKFKGNFVKDAFHYQFYVNKVLLIDSYEGQSKEVRKIREIISKIYQDKIDYFCDSYD